MFRSWSGPRVLAAVVALILACSNGKDEQDDDQFREDVIVCEEAVARLEHCCPGFDVRSIECRYRYAHREGCGTTTTERTEPAFTKAESACVRAASCEDLVAKGACTRASDAGAARTTVTVTTNDGGTPNTTTTTPPERAAVCP